MIERYGSIRTGLIAQAIDAANTAHLDLCTEEGRRAAGPDGVIPDDARRPIGIDRLADSMGLPFESTRQTVQRLVDQGDCLFVDGGVLAAVDGPGSARTVIANAGYVRRLVRDFEAVSLAEPPPARDRVAAEDLAVARRVLRPSTAYLLRWLSLLAESYGDARTGILAQTIIVANTAHLDTRAGQGRRYVGLDQNPPDRLRRPISVAQLAESLGTPLEGKQQHVQRLIDDGICIRVRGGLIVPGTVLERPTAVRGMLANVGYVRRLVRDLRLIGF